MSSIIQILRRIGGAKAAPTSGSAGQLALWKAGSAPTDAASLYAHDGAQWVELLDTARVALRNVANTFTQPQTLPAQVAGTRDNTAATMQMFAAEFTNSIVGNGYQKLPSGLIIQWGTVTNSNDQGAGLSKVTFPITFPTGPLNINMSATAAVGGATVPFTAATVLQSSITVSSFTWCSYGPGTINLTTLGPGGTQAWYMAIGY